MKLFLSLAVICLSAAACHSPSQDNNNRLSVDDDALVRVPVSDREDINKARTEAMAVEDRVAVAEHDVENAKERLDIARHAASIAKEEAEVAHERCKLAAKENGDLRDDEKKKCAERCQGAGAHARWADAQIVYHEHVVDDMKARVDLEKARADLAKAQVELAKAKAVNDADKDDVDPYDIAAFEANVAAHKLDVEMAEVDRDAWTKKMKLCHDAVEERAKAVPAGYRDGVSKTEEVPVPKDPK